jgi:hypothetical protein
MVVNVGKKVVAATVAATMESSRSHKVARSPYTYKYQLATQVDRIKQSSIFFHLNQAVSNRKPGLRLLNTRRLTRCRLRETAH